MASLSAHLREPGDHGRLAFHPECPVCRRDRLAGALTGEAIVGRRTQALLAAGVLVLSSTAPTAVLAAEPDQEREGTAAPGETVAVGPATDPNLDPGGESTDLPFDAGSPTDAQAAPDPDGDAGALELEPATNEDAPVADAGDQTSTERPSEQQAPSTSDTVTPQPTSPQAPPVAEPTPAPAEPAATSAPTAPDADSTIRALTGGEIRRKERRTPADAPSQPVRGAPAPPEPVVVVSESSEAAPVFVPQEPSAPSQGTVGTNGRAARLGDRFHVVLAGESLWSIANDVLGADASVAQIAREVNRLWERNSDRIGTGDPDLLMVGTRLALR